MREAGLSNVFCPSVCQCVMTTKGLNASKRHSNNDNSEKNSAWWSGLIRTNFQLFVAVVSFPDCATRHKSDWGRDYRGRGYTELGYEFSQ